MSRQTNRLKAQLAHHRALIASYRRLTGRLIAQAEDARRERITVPGCAATADDHRCQRYAGHDGSHRVDFGAGSFLTWGK